MADIDVSLGEIYRLVQDLKIGFKDHQREMREDRIELRQQLREAREEVREAMAPIAVLETTVAEHETKLRAIGPKVDDTVKNTAINATFISVGVTLLTLLASLLLQGKVGR